MANLYSSTRNVEVLLIKIAYLLEKLSNDSIQGGFFLPVTSTNAAAPNNSIYFSSDDNALDFKDAGGVSHPLY